MLRFWERDLPALVRSAAVECAEGALLKVLLTDACTGNCRYCEHRRDRDAPRHAARPEDMARALLQLACRGGVRGVLLSSGIWPDADRAQQRIVETAEILRRWGWPGYIHGKMMPGARPHLVRELFRWCDRVSVNLEAPTSERLAHLSPTKRFGELVGCLRFLSAVNRERPCRSGITTQLVVGTGETDRELLELAELAYRRLGLRRVYYSPFRPARGTPLEEAPACPPERARRLYQADALVRCYGFSARELPYDEAGNLPRDRDPKLAWAQSHPERFPLEVNRASEQELLRVPGIGPAAARAIVRARREGRIRDWGALRRLGALPQARAWLLLDGRRA